MSKARMMNSVEAAAYLRMDHEHFMELVNAGVIPCHQGNPSMHFDDGELFALPSAILNLRPKPDPVAARAALYENVH